jgi:hypothetical protein
MTFGFLNTIPKPKIVTDVSYFHRKKRCPYGDLHKIHVAPLCFHTIMRGHRLIRLPARVSMQFLVHVDVRVDLAHPWRQTARGLCARPLVYRRGMGVAGAQLIS